MSHPHGRDLVDVRVKIPRVLYERMTILCLLRGEIRHEWMRTALLNAIESGLAAFPARVVWLRPGATIYSRDGSTYTPICRAAGGERAWPIEVVPFPSTIAPDRQGWCVDVTSDSGGYEGRGVFVAMDDVVGVQPRVSG